MTAEWLILYFPSTVVDILRSSLLNRTFGIMSVIRDMGRSKRSKSGIWSRTDILTSVWPSNGTPFIAELDLETFLRFILPKLGLILDIILVP